MNFDFLREGVAAADEVLFAEAYVRLGYGTKDQVEEVLRQRTSETGERLHLAQLLLKRGLLDTPGYVQILKSLDRGGPPDRVGRYVIEREIARGGMGIVYRAMDPELRRPIALKVIRGDTGDGASAARLRREAIAAAKLRHPNIVTVHEAGVADGRAFIAMDFVQGTTLRNVLRDESPGIPRAAAFLESVARALQHAHEHGVVHRDMKPENVLVDRDGRALVTDFGLARIADGSQRLTRTGEMMGTPLYMAPEQFRGDAAAIGPCTDVYALGVMLYEILAGSVPYEASTFMELSRMALAGDPVPPTRRRADAPRDLEAVALKAMQVEPGDRYRTAGDFADELRRFLDGQPVQASRPSWLTRQVRRMRRRPLAAAAVLVVVAAASVAGVAVWSGREARLQRDEAKRRLEGTIRDIETLADDAVEKYEFALLAPPHRLDREEADLDRTLELLRRLYAENPEAHEALVSAGKVHHRLGRFAEAASAIEDGIGRLGPRAAGRHFLARAMLRISMLGDLHLRKESFTTRDWGATSGKLLESAKADLEKARSLGLSLPAARERYVQAVVSFVSKDGEACRKACSALVDDAGTPPPLRADALMLMADSYGDSGHTQTVLDLYSKAIDIKRSDKRLLFDTAWALRRGTPNGLQQGLAISAAALQVDDRWAWPWMARGILFTEIARGKLTAGQDPAAEFAEAERALEKSIALDPAEPYFLAQRSYFHYTKGYWLHVQKGLPADAELASCLQDAETALARNAHLRTALHIRSTARSFAARLRPEDALDNLRQALADLDQLLADHPGEWNLLMDRADVHQLRAEVQADPAERERALADGIADARAAVDREPGQGRSRFLLGKLHFTRAQLLWRQGRPCADDEAAALDAYAGAIRLSPEDYRPFVDRADLRFLQHARLQDASLLDLAEEDCRAAIKLAPGVGLPYAALGHTLALKGKCAEALEEFRKGIELDRSLERIFKADLEYCRARVPGN